MILDSLEKFIVSQMKVSLQQLARFESSREIEKYNKLLINYRFLHNTFCRVIKSLPEIPEKQTSSVVEHNLEELDLLIETKDWSKASALIRDLTQSKIMDLPEKVNHRRARAKRIYEDAIKDLIDSLSLLTNSSEADKYEK